MDKIKNKPVEHRLALVIFTARESLDVLIPSLEAAIRATNDNTVIDVLVNGNQALADSLKRWKISHITSNNNKRIRIWAIKTGDKANAWNQYFHKIWSGEELAFFSDGYVSLQENSIGLLSEAVLENEQALGGTGVPTTGQTARHLAKKMLGEGGFHGNFCCVRGSAIAEIRQRNFRIPLGLYRTDSLLGAVLTFGFDPAKNTWNPRRIHVHPQATWITPPKHWWRYQEWMAFTKRRIRQAKGILENAAIRDHLAGRKQPPETLQKTATELVNEWMKRCPREAQATISHNPLTRLVLSSYTRSESWVESDLIPKNMDF